MRCYKLALLFVALLSLTTTTQAGIISLLTKAGKAVKEIDIDLPITKLELPSVADDVSPISIKPRHTGEWDLTLADGKRMTLSDFSKNNTEGLGNQMFIIRESDLPSDLSYFNTIPDTLPLFITSNKNRVFELQRGDITAVKYKNIQVAVRSVSDIKDSLWHLQRAPINNSVRIFQLDKNIKNEIVKKAYGSRVTVERMNPIFIEDSFNALKRQTVVVSGEIRDGKLYNGSVNTPIKSLQKAAAENDISLIIIESNDHVRTLRKIAIDGRIHNKDVTSLYDTTGDFLNRFRASDNNETLRVELSDTAYSQTVIQFQPTVKKIVVTASPSMRSDFSLLPFNLLGKVASIYRPDLDRSRELDRRWVEWISTNIQYYIIISIILGWISFSTSWKLWNIFWQIQTRCFYRNYFVFRGVSLIHITIFIVIFIPLLGLMSFIYALISMIVNILNIIFIKPVVWGIKRITG